MKNKCLIGYSLYFVLATVILIMGIVIEIQPYKTWLKRWKHKLFGCPTFWKSKWNTFFNSKPMYRCPECKKAMHCYWDGNDTKKGIDYCDKCASNCG